MAKTSTSSLYTLLLGMTDTVNYQNIDRSSSDILYMNSCNKGKGTVHPCTGTEALYRPYGP